MFKAIIALVVLAALGAGGWYGWRWFHKGGSDEINYKTAKVEKGELMTSIGASGTVEPEDLVDVGAQVGGQILEFGKDAKGRTVDYGSEVEADAVLAKIDDFPWKMAVSQATNALEEDKAELAKAEAILEQTRAKHYLAQTDWGRAKKLIDAKATSIAEFDTWKSAFNSSQAGLAVCEAEVRAAKAKVAQDEDSLRKAEKDLSYCVIRSPVRGVVIDRRVNIGQTVVSSLNTPSLFLIAKDLRKMQVWAAVNEAEVGMIHPGQGVRFTVSAFPNEKFKGEVRKIRLNASVTQNVVTYIVEVATDNSSGRLLPYLTASVRFELKRLDSVLKVPNSAVRWMPESLTEIEPESRQMFSSGKDKDGAKPPEAKGYTYKNGIVWVRKGKFLSPLKIFAGLSDGSMSEVVGPGLKEGLEVVTGVLPKVKEEVKNPFSTQVMGNKR